MSSRMRRLKSNPRAAGRCSAMRFRYTSERVCDKTDAMSFLKGRTIMNEFQGKVGILTGGTSGIGRAAAIAYAREGARVVVAGRRAAEGEETVRLLRAQGGEGFFVTTDVS